MTLIEQFNYLNIGACPIQHLDQHIKNYFSVYIPVYIQGVSGGVVNKHWCLPYTAPGSTYKKNIFVYIYIYIPVYIQGILGGIVNILGGGSMEYSV